jgi:Reverse transcriptase (RNA-dependent DNA polymerase)
VAEPARKPKGLQPLEERFLISMPYHDALCGLCPLPVRLLYREAAVAHHKNNHHSVPCLYICAKCQRTFKTCGPAVNHARACSGAAPPGQWQCGDCDKSYDTRRSLGQHARTHTAVQGMEHPHSGLLLPTSRAWDAESTAMLLELAWKLRTAAFKNVDIAEKLPGKTAHQVRDKRNTVEFKQAYATFASMKCREKPTVQDLEERGTAAIGLTTAPLSGPPEQGHQPMEPTEPLNGPTVEAGTEPPDKWRTLMRQAIAAWKPCASGELAYLVEPLKACRNQETIDRVYNDIVQAMREVEVQAPGAPPRPKKKRGPGAANRAKFRFARTQELFKDSPSILAKHVLQGTDPLSPSSGVLDRDEVKQLYQSLWGTRAASVSIPASQPPVLHKAEEFLKPFSSVEVALRIKKFDKHTAAGLDGVGREHLMGEGKEEILAQLFNSLLESRNLPACWSKNRTTLIPKEGKDPTLTTNYRPITISALLSRLFWGLVDQRLRTVIVLSPRQKGFVKEAGCFNNAHILQETMRRMKESRGGVVVQLDVKKAFDTAPHAVITQSLVNKGIPSFVAEFIAKSYLRVETLIGHKLGPIRIDLLRGVKQGDPLSPLLFTLLIEPLLDMLEQEKGYQLLDELELCAMAFADDISLIACTVPEAQVLLSMVRDYLQDLGMGLAAEKSLAIHIIEQGRVGAAHLTLGDEPVPTAHTKTKFRYLGVNYSASGIADKGPLEKSLSEALRRVQQLALKPAQKVVLIKRHLVPHFIHPLVMSNVGVSQLDRMDAEIRRAIKSAFHLAPCTANELFYVKNSNGGLGIPCLRHTVPCTALRLGQRYWESSDPVIRALRPESKLEKRMRGYAVAVGVPWPCSEKIIDKAKLKYQETLLTTWKAKRFYGQLGAYRAGDSIGNRVLTFPQLLRPARLALFLRALSNTAGTNVARRKTDKSISAMCRHCPLRETVGHIVGDCVQNHALIIARHNWVRDQIEQELKIKGILVDKEVRFKLKPSKEGAAKMERQPDLVARLGDMIYVIDVTVRTERVDFVKDAQTDKRGHYGGGRLRKKLIAKYKEQDGREQYDVMVLTAVFGSFGHVPSDTKAELQLLGIGTTRWLRKISLHILDSTLFMLGDFLSSPQRDQGHKRKADTPTPVGVKKRKCDY